MYGVQSFSEVGGLSNNEILDSRLAMYLLLGTVWLRTIADTTVQYDTIRYDVLCCEVESNQNALFSFSLEMSTQREGVVFRASGEPQCDRAILTVHT
jgi:hypothetical protein